jgi:hypothetical protein
MLAGHRQIADIDAGVLTTLGALNIDPPMAVQGLFIGIRKPLVANVLILTSHKAIVAVVA